MAASPTQRRGDVAAEAERLANEVLADRRKVEDLVQRAAANKAALAELSSGRCGTGRGGCMLLQGDFFLRVSGEQARAELEADQRGVEDLLEEVRADAAKKAERLRRLRPRVAKPPPVVDMVLAREKAAGGLGGGAGS